MPMFYACYQDGGSTRPVFSVAVGAGNLFVAKPGNLGSTLVIDAGIAFAFGESL
jgi:hypothetical protein